ncbi:MAG TPA: GIY-YIG nuclease family protein [Phycisphaerae bacterium]|nr:GIY-YIG nuclease family protein [Phycisphaerae bacterium]HUT60424.1 GIY-YIG nuclease family protein [Phycisphaerae bacterium]
MEGVFWYVYMLRSQADSDRYYVGLAKDLHERLRRHNARQVLHTAKHVPWQIETAVAFRSKTKAVAFEKYLKTHSGRAFAKKHF